MPASSGSRESPLVKKMRLKRGLQPAVGLEPVEHTQRLVVHAPVGFVRVAVDGAFGELVDVVVGDDPDLAGLADERGIVEDHLPELGRRPGADEAAHHPPVLAAGRIREELRQRIGDQGREVGLADDLGIARALGVDDRRVERDVQLDVGLAEGRPALGDDREEENSQQAERQDDRTQAQALEHALAAVAALGECGRILEGRTRARRQAGERRGDGGLSHTSLDRSSSRRAR